VTTIRVLGTPAPQGSKRAYALRRNGVLTGKTTLVESSAKVKPWRQAVIDAAAGSAGYLEGPVQLSVVFFIARPRGHYGTGRNAGKVRKSAPVQPAGKPDLDKLVRSTMDALTAAGWWRDDCQVVTLTAAKFYTSGETLPGASIQVTGYPR
jgi:Holliday junction resolvase RusA-like endonuclease